MKKPVNAVNEIYSHFKIMRVRGLEDRCMRDNLERFLAFDHLVKGHYFRLLSSRINADVFRATSRRKLVDHLIRNRNLKHSLSWYSTEQQALAFAQMTVGSTNHQIEMELINRIFTNNIKEIIPRSSTYIPVVDVGCGSGEKSFEIIKNIQESGRSVNFYAIDGSPYIIFLALERLARYYGVKIYDPESIESAMTKMDQDTEKMLKSSLKTVTNFLCSMVDNILLEDMLSYIITDKSVSAVAHDSRSDSLEADLNRVISDVIKTWDDRYRRKYGWYYGEEYFEELKYIEDELKIMIQDGYVDENVLMVKELQPYFNRININIEETNCSADNLVQIATDILIIYNNMKMRRKYYWTDALTNNAICVNEVITLSTNYKSHISVYMVDYPPSLWALGLVGDILDKDFIQRVTRTVSAIDLKLIFDFRDEKEELLMLFLGQTLGNFSPDDRRDILSNLYNLPEFYAKLLIGVELRPDNDFPGYEVECDRIAEKYTGGRIFLDETVRLLGGNPDAVEFNAVYNHEINSVEMFYQVKDGRTLELSDGERTIAFNSGEVIPVASSYKFAPNEVEDLCQSVGFKVVANQVFIPPPKNNQDTRPEYEIVLVKK